MPDPGIWFILAVAIAAFLYSSIGHGGASGYLTLMVLFGVSVEFMRPSALSLNLLVAGLSFYGFYKAGHFRWKLLAPFVATSIPAAFIGAQLPLSDDLYRQILGICLIFAVARMLLKLPENKEGFSIPPIWISLLVGALLGFFSGMIGIGGGIILSPIILIFGWAGVKEAAATSAAFIWLNSLAGLLGVGVQGLPELNVFLPWVIAGFIGGIIGSYIGSVRLNTIWLRRILAFVLLFASFKLLFT